MNWDGLLSGVSKVQYMRHCTHMARTAVCRLAMNRHSCADGNKAVITVEAWVVDMRDRTVSGIGHRGLEVLARVGHGSGAVICGHSDGQDVRGSYKGSKVVRVDEKRLATDTKVVVVMVKTVVVDQGRVGRREDVGRMRAGWMIKYV